MRLLVLASLLSSALWSASNAQDLPILTQPDVETYDPAASVLVPTITNQHYISDDGYVHVPLQFPYPFYDQVFTNSFMYSNGVVGFIDPRTGYCCNGEDLTITTNPNINYSIMPLWTDLTNYSGVFITEGSTEFQRYTWENISEYGMPGNLNTFSLEILPDGSYTMLHDQINITNHSYTIGDVGRLSFGEYVQHVYAPQGGSYSGVIDAGPGVDMCSIDPLFDPSCSGYQEAFFQQQCAVNALYDPGCYGYEQAYYNYQCSLDPLYDVGCTGYENAYFSYQCSLDSLYDNQCPGYAQAYYDLQCLLSPLYDSECEGYTEAYTAYILDRTCSANAQADPRCLGYVVPSSRVEESIVVSIDTETISTPSVTGDSVIDSIIRQEVPDLTLSSLPQEDLQVADVEQQNDNQEEQSVSEETKNEETTERREEVRAAAVERAKNLANQMSEVASVEAQKAIQEQVLALMNYTPGFEQYGLQINGGYYPDSNFYDSATVPESRTGLRNGLAQQILHNRMVDMQYDRKE
jgi:hypothetical protein